MTAWRELAACDIVGIIEYPRSYGDPGRPDLRIIVRVRMQIRERISERHEQAVGRIGQLHLFVVRIGDRRQMAILMQAERGALAIGGD